MDGILTADDWRYRQMEEASTKLLNAITLAQLGRNPMTPSELLWTGQSFAGRVERELVQHDEPVATRRNPCARCGVRQDFHANHGCGVYVVGGFGA